MKLEYRNGVRVSKLVHEMSPLEAAMKRYDDAVKTHEKSVREHYSENNKDLYHTKEERLNRKQEALKFLENERRQLETISEVQAMLEAYRAEGMASKQGTKDERSRANRIMQTEKHHPTELLEKFMRAEGVPKPSSKHTAHHIVPGSGRWQKVLLARARTHLHAHGIRINDPANGVYLLTKDEYAPHWSMPQSRGHLTYHTNEYEKWVYYRVYQKKHIDSIKTELQVIGRLLQDNEPKTAIAAMRKM